MTQCGRKPVIGLAGGIGSGKSSVAEILASLSAGVITSDDLNHQVLNEPAIREQLRQWWGSTVLDSQGQVDRSRVRQIVAENPHERQRLEQLVHPRIAELSDRLAERYQQTPGITAVVWDTPLLFEVGLDKRCDAVIFVDADPDLRCQRVMAKRGWTPDDWARMEKNQKPLDMKREKADYRVVNNSDLDSLRRATMNVFSQIRSGFQSENC